MMLPVILLSGCSIPGNSDSSAGNVLKSSDGGKNWELKVKIDEEKNIAGVNVLSMAIDSRDSKTVYLGTKEDGIFVTRDGGESWKKLNFPPVKVYGLALDRFNSPVIYATGVWQGRGKIYKSQNSGEEWKEIYTEPANGTVIISLAISTQNSQALYAGTSEGAVFKTVNGGETWVNLTKAQGPVYGIVFDPANDDIVYFLVLKKAVLRTKDGGTGFEDLVKNIAGGKLLGSGQVFSLAADAHQSGIVFAGLDNGIIKSTDFGDTWNPLNVLESSKEFPVQAIAVNPLDSKELIYSAAQAVYKSIDGGVQWSTTQLQTNKVVNAIQYDPANPGVIYLGLKKE